MYEAVAKHRAHWATKTEAEREARIETLLDDWDEATIEASETDVWDKVCEIEWELEALGYCVDDGR